MQRFAKPFVVYSMRGFDPLSFRQILKPAERMDEIVLLEGSDTRPSGVPAGKGQAVRQASGRFMVKCVLESIFYVQGQDGECETIFLYAVIV